jgi:hypothetical protein
VETASASATTPMIHSGPAAPWRREYCGRRVRDAHLGEPAPLALDGRLPERHGELLSTRAVLAGTGAVRRRGGALPRG